MAKKSAREKRYAFSDKRFFADCTECGMRFENDSRENTIRRCCCGALLTWNDAEKARTLEGVRECKK